MINLAYEEIRRETSAIVDLASEWAFTVYRNIMKATGNKEMAGQTANRVYNKLLEQAGIDV